MRIKNIDFRVILHSLFISFVITGGVMTLSALLMLGYALIPTGLFCFLCLWVLMFLCIIWAHICKNK